MIQNTVNDPDVELLGDEDLMGRPSRDYEQISLRIPTAWLKEAEEIARLISKPGIEATRADALRHAIARGFEVLRAEAKASAKKK